MEIESYIVGLIDGEGTISVVRYPDGRVRPQVLLFNTHIGVLELVKNKLKLSAPILKVSRINDGINRKKEMYRLQIRSKEDIRKMFDVFERCPPIIKHDECTNVLKLTKSWLIT
ncbi:MAG: hypothetical protein FJY76_02190 [Candidatus Aenigmarchaeota archaeon]|nr:hypothetical protein [Candidatus Aenigmarchaeota archaeon]